MDIFLGFSMAFMGMYGMYFPVGSIIEPDANIDDEVYECAIDVMKSNRLRVFQNAGYDLNRIKNKLNVDLNGPFVCTMIIAHMVDENLPSKSLDNLHKHYTGGVGKIKDPLMQNIIDTMGWRYIPVYLMNEYGTQDAIATSELWMELEDRYIAQFGPLFSEEVMNGDRRSLQSHDIST